MAKKKEVDKTEEVDDNNEVEFEYTHTSYLPVYNAERKAIDIWNIRVNVETAEMLVDVEEMRYQEMYRAVHEVKIRMDQDLIRRKK